MIVYGGINKPFQSQPIQSWPTDGGVYIPPRVAPTVRNLNTGDAGNGTNPITLQVGQRLKHRIVCYGCPEAIIVPSNLPPWLTVGFGGPTQLVSAGTGQGNGGQNGNPPGIGQPFNPWFSALGGTCDGQWLHGTPSASHIGTYAIQFHAHNGVAPDSSVYTIHVVVEPQPGAPEFITPPPLDAEAGEGWAYIPSTTVTGGGTATISKTAGPAWLTWNPTLGLLEGKPPYAASNQSFSVELTATAQGPNGPVSGAQAWTLFVDYNRNDANRDSLINITDVQLTVNLILAQSTPQWPGQGDVNSDSLVNVIDVQQIVNKILNP